MTSSLFFSLFSVQASALSGEPTSTMLCMTNSFAPPCSGPLSAPIAAVMADHASDCVEVTVRAVKVEALKECSAYRMSDFSKASMSDGIVAGEPSSSPKTIQRKFSAKLLSCDGAR